VYKSTNELFCSLHVSAISDVWQHVNHGNQRLEVLKAGTLTAKIPQMLMQETGTINDPGNLFSMTSSGPTTPQTATLNSTYLATTKELSITGIPCNLYATDSGPKPHTVSHAMQYCGDAWSSPAIWR